MSRKEQIKTVASILITLASSFGEHVTPVCDGDRRHHSKRASQKRLYDRKFTHLSGTIARYESLVLDAKFNNKILPHQSNK